MRSIKVWWYGLLFFAVGLVVPFLTLAAGLGLLAWSGMRQRLSVMVSCGTGLLWYLLFFHVLEFSNGVIDQGYLAPDALLSIYLLLIEDVESAMFLQWWTTLSSMMAVLTFAFLYEVLEVFYPHARA